LTANPGAGSTAGPPNGKMSEMKRSSWAEYNENRMNSEKFSFFHINGPQSLVCRGNNAVPLCVFSR
jgi:hypothetical protein